MDKFRFARSAAAVLPVVLPLIVALLYFTGVVWESNYYREFDLNSGVLGSGFSDLVVTGFVAWFYTGVEVWSWFVGLSFALLFAFVLLAVAYERKWLARKVGGDKRLGSSKGERGEVPQHVVKLVLGSSVMLFSSALLLVSILFTVALVGVAGYFASKSAGDLKTTLFVSDWQKGEKYDRNIWLTDSCEPLIERRQIGCTAQACVFATKSGYEAIPMHNIKRISSSTLDEPSCSS